MDFLVLTKTTDTGRYFQCEGVSKGSIEWLGRRECIGSHNLSHHNAVYNRTNDVYPVLVIL